MILFNNGDIGDTEYSNTTLEENKVTFSHGTSVCITKDDSESAQVILFYVIFNFSFSNFSGTRCSSFIPIFYQL